MAIVESSLWCRVLCFAIAINVILAKEIPSRNTSTLLNAGSANETLSAPEVWESPNTPIESRILVTTNDPKRSTNPSDYPGNYTTFATTGSQIVNYVLTTPKLTATPQSVASPQSSKITDFKPSVHIGEINDYGTRKLGAPGRNPFNKLKHIAFENTVRIDESIDTDGASLPPSSFRDSSERVTDSIVGTSKIPVKFFETSGRYGDAAPIDAAREQHQHEYYEPHRVRLQLPAGVIHVDDDNDSHKSHDQYHNGDTEISLGQEVTFDRPRSPGFVPPETSTVVRSVYPSVITEPQSHHYQHQRYVIPSNHLHTVYSKPTKLHDDAVTSSPNAIQFEHYPSHQYAPIASGEVYDKPEVPSFHHQPGNYQGGNYHQGGIHHHGVDYHSMSPHDTPLDHVVKPDTLLYVTSHRQSAVTTMRQFPYKFYEPSFAGHQDEYHYSLQEVPHVFPLKERRISPWKKIIHLIGAFLPFGLLLAALKPHVVRIENTTQPNIVLSKLRVIDLPAEHKLDRPADTQPEDFQQDTCDDRSICELIVSGSEPNSNLLQNILWNLTNKSTDEEAQKHGLQEIFSAAKRKDCSSIDC